MPNLWPFLTLLPPSILTARGGRTAWLWMSLAVGLVILYGAFQFTLFQLAAGHAEFTFGFLVYTPDAETAVLRGYTTFADFSWIGPMILPLIVVGALLNIGTHPNRTRTDVALFWGTALLAALSVYIVPIALQNGGMPRRYIEYDEIIPYYRAANLVSLAAMALACVAAARPLISLYRAQKTRA